MYSAIKNVNSINILCMLFYNKEKGVCQEYDTLPFGILHVID